MLIRESLKKTFDDASSRVGVCFDVLGGRSNQDIIQVAQLHETNVGIRIVQLGEQGGDALGGLTTILCHDADISDSD